MAVTSFKPRLSRLSPRDMWNNHWWYSSGNIFYNAPYPSGNGLPNCTCYSYGRVAEINEKFLDNLGVHGNGGTWIDEVSSDYEVGQEPQLGAIACYGPSSTSPSTAVGHVAVVEEIHENGDIVTSNSGYHRDTSAYPQGTEYKDPRYFWIETCPKDLNYRANWMLGSDYQYNFQGFIYASGKPKFITKKKGLKVWQMCRPYKLW